MVRSNRLVLSVSFPVDIAQPTTHDAYADALAAELETLSRDLRTRSFAAVRLGCGAGLASRDALARLVSCVRSVVHLEPHAQVTLDCPTAGTGMENVADWAACGIDRVRLGAPRTNKQLDVALDCLACSNPTVVDMQLCFGSPGQSVAAWEQVLHAVAQREVPHLTTLPLNGKDNACEGSRECNDMLLEHYSRARLVLEGCGYREYALGRFVATRTPDATDAFCDALCAGAGQLGVGAGARSRYDGFAYRNRADVSSYVSSSDDYAALLQDAHPENPELVLERVTLGLLDRLVPFDDALLATACGFPADAPLPRDLATWLANAAKDGLVRCDELGFWRLTERGRVARLCHRASYELL